MTVEHRLPMLTEPVESTEPRPSIRESQVQTNTNQQRWAAPEYAKPSWGATNREFFPSGGLDQLLVNSSFFYSCLMRRAFAGFWKKAVHKEQSANSSRSIPEAEMTVDYKAIPSSRFHFSVSRTAVKWNLESSPNAEAHRRKIFGPSFVVGITHGLRDTNQMRKQAFC